MWDYVLLGLKTLGVLVLLEVILIRFIPFCLGYRHYSKQGLPFFQGVLPFVGNYLRLVRLMQEVPRQEFVPFGPMIKQDFGSAHPPEVIVSMMQQQPVLVLNSAKSLTELYVTKNRFFEKDPIGAIQFGSLFGQSIVLAPSDEVWAKKRKVLGSAFYKEKLFKMVGVIREIVREKIVEIEKEYVEKRYEMDVVSEMGDLHMRIILMTAFGLTDLHQVKLPYIEGGVTKQMKVADILRQLTSYMIFRAGRYMFAVIPYMMFFYYSKEDREYMANIRTVRNFCLSIIERRRKNLAASPNEDKCGDILTIMLQQPSVFATNDSMIDEIITFFLAGSFTLKTTNSNLLMYLDCNPKVYSTLMGELRETVFCEALKNGGSRIEDPIASLSIESVEGLRYFSQCFYETLRLEPPTVASGGIFTEDQEVCGVKIRKHDFFVINMQQMHHDRTEWQRPSDFIPERFDSLNPLSLRPDGAKRHPLAFNPFIGGKRICLGKTFAEIVAKFVVPALLGRFKFEHVDTDIPKGIKPKIIQNLNQVCDPIVPMQVSIVDWSKKI
ncbi:hypothetical protein FGO68_gene6044 [Halteria grandinella]|uniref:Cytochrome P450 n=1 Tax=Halteria grandinella TaxID=5974 RepID=A0A8J8T3I6_HALGN|nr:hypothetical protein FGO68_gene6044 [Halteria grandinella]